MADADRAAYHAAAVIASNHLVALLGQAERVAAWPACPSTAYLDLVRATVDNVAELGPAAALTGPAARGDDATIERHLDALPETSARPTRRSFAWPVGWWIDAARLPTVDVHETIASFRDALDRERATDGRVGSGADHGLPARRAPLADARSGGASATSWR